jgi:hypothetical protein
MCFFAFVSAFSALCTLSFTAVGMRFGVIHVLQSARDSSQNAHLGCGKVIML